MTAFTTLSGRGGHATKLALSVGATWSFSPAQLVRKNGNKADSRRVWAGMP